MRIVVGPLDAVATILAEHQPERVISLLAPGHTPPITGRPHLHLAVNDLVAPRTGLVAPSSDTVAQLLTFGLSGPRDATILAHCWFGISRSPAAAYILACAVAGPGCEARMAERLRAASPECTPNPRMIALADARLRRGGAMMAAIATIGRGRETDCGRPFVLEA